MHSAFGPFVHALASTSDARSGLVANQPLIYRFSRDKCCKLNTNLLVSRLLLPLLAFVRNKSLGRRKCAHPSSARERAPGSASSLQAMVGDIGTVHPCETLSPALFKQRRWTPSRTIGAGHGPCYALRHRRFPSGEAKLAQPCTHPGRHPPKCRPADSPDTRGRWHRHL